MDKRGVVIAGLCDARIVEEQATVRCPPLDLDLIRMSLLYWDRIDIPDSDVATVRLPQELDVLMQENILSRKLVSSRPASGFKHLVRLGSGSSLIAAKNITVGGQKIDLLTLINEAPIKAFEELVQEQDILWSYFQNSPTVIVPENTKVPGRSLLFEIYEALPVPTSDTPIDKILEFKANRTDELSALRSEIDSIYQQISNATDIEHAKSMAFNKLESALSDLSKVANENLGSKLARSLKFEINPIGMAAATTALAAGSVTVGALVAFGSCFKLDCSETVFKTDLPQRLTPYKYVFDARAELPDARLRGHDSIG
ncbi:MAG: hypothetical protein IAE63_01000 [Alphaproteobacteria bacterium]|nr:hypothetical protein [Alphaproteobacteria bacterium]